MEEHKPLLKLNIGCGRKKINGYIGLDKIQFIDNNNSARVDMVRDIDLHGLPFCDNSIEEILAESFFEHIENLEFVLNECWRVLKIGGILKGNVPDYHSNGAFRDPTHKRFFSVDTFKYFCGTNEVNPNYPEYPRYARYGFLAWEEIEILRPNNNGSIYFKLKPRK